MKTQSSMFWTLLAFALAVLPSLPSAGAVPTEVGEELQVNEFTTDEQDEAVVAGLPGGGFVVVWESTGQDSSGDGVFARIVSSQGTALGSDLSVNTSTRGFQEDAAVAVAADGSFVVVWDDDNLDGDERGIFGQRFDAAGAKVGGELQINQITQGDQNDPVVAMQPGGEFVVVWESMITGATIEEDLVGLRFASDGSRIGIEFTVNTTVAGDQEDAEIATDAAGNFVVVWESEQKDGSLDAVVARRFNASGSPLGGEIQVNTYTQGDQANPALAVTEDGSFVVTWDDDTVQLPDDTIVARFFDAEGAATTDEIAVDVFPGTFQILPAVALDGEGQAHLAWQSLGQDGSDGGIYRRSLDPDGSFASDELQVNSYTLGHQVEANLAVDGRGLVAIVWTSEGQDGSFDGVFAQRYTTAFFSDGFETGDTTGWTATQN